MVKSVVEELFPFDSFRDKQHIVIEEALDALYNHGYNNVVIDGPVGTGKSAINTTLLKYADNGFYTTPSKSLREQLQNDEVLQNHVRSLKARRDYTCGVTADNCKDCRINKSDEQSCSEMADCTYWNAKMGAINHQIAVITFSYLIVDGMLPAESAEGTPISFMDRESLVVDESQNLVQQTASLHAGTKISPYKLPDGVFGKVTDSVSMDANLYEDVSDEVEEIRRRCEDFIRDIIEMEMTPEERRCKNLAEKISWIQDQVENDNPWVVEVESDNYQGNFVKTVELIPVDVSSFLDNFVWNRANKRIISTATLPYRKKPEIWLRQVGLDPDKTKVISVPMPFPVENRPIHTSSMVCSMKSGGDKNNWSDIMEKLNQLSKRHYNQKALIHTSSYKRARRIEDSVNEDDYPYLYGNVFLHKQNEDLEEQIEDWQSSTKDIMLSPAMYEGVDLPGDKCRWQVLLKVPYPSRDARTKYMIENTDYGWADYFERALIRVVQSYGRAIRSKKDKADYYILDKDFEDLMKKRTAPEWFTEAIDVKAPEQRSVFDY